MIEVNRDAQRAKASRQNLLFGAEEEETREIPAEIRALPEWDEALKLTYEKDALGFYITGHPLAENEKRLRSLVSHFVGDLEDAGEAGFDVTMAGIIQGFRNLKTRKNEPMCTFGLEDLTGRVEVLAFPSVFESFYENIRDDLKVWIKGRYTGDAENRKVQLAALLPLEAAFEKMATRVVVRVFLPGLEEMVVSDLEAILRRFPGACPVVFELEKPFVFKALVESSEVKSVAPSEALVTQLEALLGEDTVKIEY